MKTRWIRRMAPVGCWLACLAAARAGDVEVELTPSDSFFVKHNAGITQLIVHAAGGIGMGMPPTLHRLSIRSGTSTVDGSALYVENINDHGIAVVTDTASADVNTILGQRGAGDFLYCDSSNGTTDWQRVICLRKDGAIESRGLKLSDAGSGGGQYGLFRYTSGTCDTLGFFINGDGTPALAIRSTQNIGIGTTDPGGHRLSVKSDADGTAGSTVEIENTNSAGLAVMSSAWSSDVNTLLSQHGSGDFLCCDAWDGAVNWRRVIRLFKDGTIECKVLSVTGGADFAEPFDLSDGAAPSPEPGTVMVIDPGREGRLKPSERAYDRCVAGVVSGAGGVTPGVLLQQGDAGSAGRHPVALSGRVYAWADATDAPIAPGDLLTTSDTPGHAMKATDLARAQGAVLGKAMTALPGGRGLVLMLVTLQ